MPSVFSHAIAAVAIGGVAASGPSRAVLWSLGTVCAVLPDLDVVSVYLGVPYRHMLGHRGISHSLPFAAVLALVVTAVASRVVPASPSAPRLWAFFFLATASHGLLDSMTNGGLGVAFFAPFSETRYFAPWRPILVSPISVPAFFSYHGLRVMWSELGWVWLPAALVFVAALALRRATSRRLPSGAS
jgi:inner membrane protein